MRRWCRRTQRRTDSARTGCSVPLSRGDLAIDRQRRVGGMEHVLIVAETVHRLRIGVYPAFDERQG